MPAAKPTPAIAHTAAPGALVPWMTPELTGVNRLPGRAWCWPYRSTADALADRDAQVVSLDGTWRFALVPEVEATPAGFAEVAHDDAGWSDIRVPGCWTMQGFAKPAYTNVRMPFDEKPPFVPKANPTGLYRTWFEVPKAWAGRRIVIQFGSIESCGSVFVNGVAVGLSKDSRLPSAFDITALVKPGRNLLAVQVIQWSDGTHLEDQDQWWQAGIARSVHLYATAPAWIEDVFAHGSFDHATGSGKLIVRVKAGAITTGWTAPLCGEHVPRPADDWQAEVRLLDAKGKAMLKKPLRSKIICDQYGLSFDLDSIAVLSADLPKVAAWSHESPTLYTVVVTLFGRDGQEVEATRVRVGFRTVAIVDRELLINGRKVFIQGVNRHEHDEFHGKAVSRELMRKDVEVLKQHNVNAVRTSHYPPDPYFLELCDEHGLLVIDETNIETHHHGWIAADPRWQAAMLDRGSRMVLRDRNHACVIGWSLGNESNYGANHDAMAAWMRRADPTRIMHYEGAISRGNSTWESGHLATDLVCPMYPSIEDIVSWAKTTKDPRPLIMCEYSHAMGNSCGSLSDYWDAIRGTKGLQGGFIWEMLDHGIRSDRTDGGRPHWLYGGDFGERIHDTNFVCDGLFYPDRTPHTTAIEMKAVYAPVHATFAKGKVVIENRYAFTDLAHVDAAWELLVDGAPVARGRLPRLAIAAGASKAIALPCRVPAGKGRVDLNLRFTDRRDLPFTGKGFELACVQLGLRAAAARPWKAAGAAAELPFGKLRPEGIDLGGEPVIAGPQVRVWRAPTDNDGIRAWDMERNSERGWKKTLMKWMDAGYDSVQHRVIAAPAKRGGAWTWTTRTTGLGAKDGIDTVHTWKPLAGGAVAIEHRCTVAKGLVQLPRLGVDWVLPGDLQALAWEGHGPHETYSDRLAASRWGRYATTIAERYVPYIMPQEHGHIAGARWLALTRADGSGLLVVAQGHLEANATNLWPEDLTAARHTWDVKPRSETLLTLDAAHRGLGTGSCGPDTREPYQIQPGTYRLAYVMVPLAKGADPAAVAG